MILLIIILILFFILLKILNKRIDSFQLKDLDQNINLISSQDRDNITFFWRLDNVERQDTIDNFTLEINNKISSKIKCNKTQYFYEKILYFVANDFPINVTIYSNDSKGNKIGVSNEINLDKQSRKIYDIAGNKLKNNIQCFPNGEAFLTKTCEKLSIPLLKTDNPNIVKLNKNSNIIKKNKIILK